MSVPERKPKLEGTGMAAEARSASAVAKLERFLSQKRRPAEDGLPAVSLFSGGGISDLGYEYAGFSFLVQAELDEHRAKLCAGNFPRSQVVVGDMREHWQDVVQSYERVCTDRLALLSVTPPCQGMSSSNPSRGKVSRPDGNGRNERNLLLLAAVPVIERLRPMCVVVENVPQILLRRVRLSADKRPQKLVETFFEGLDGYTVFAGVVQMADYGVPQVRRRSVLLLLDEKLPCVRELEDRALLPWPKPTHAEEQSNGHASRVTLREWLTGRGYKALDAHSERTARDDEDPLHFVPYYDADRYLWVSQIPPNTGRSAYQNGTCPHCGKKRVKEGLVRCPACQGLMVNRPYVKGRNGRVRLVRGFKSSYRRMRPDRPAPTVTTASSHLGSDYKIHPWENRVLSIRECIELQTIPQAYSWEWAVNNGYHYLVRQVVGEAIPPWFTYLHGRVLRQLLEGKVSGRFLAEREPRA
jgi:DNA (cytosine-5)-methyltransferase 1